jgi:hypothetical protein
MIKVHNAGIVFGHKQSTVGTLLASEFCLKEARTAWGEVFLLVADSAVV